MVYLTNKLELIFDELDSEFEKSCVPIRSHFAAVSQVKELLETQQWQSCVISKKKAKKISEILERDIPLYDYKDISLREGDMIIEYIDYPLAVDEADLTDNAKKILDLMRFEIIEIVKYQHAPSVLSVEAMI